MSVEKPRFAVLLEDCENGQHGNLPFVSYFLLVLSFFPNGNSLSFTLTCGDKYPNEVPVITFNNNVRCSNKLTFNGRTVNPNCAVCRDWLRIQYNDRNLDRLLELIHGTFSK
ncbi:RWD domain-containing protein [Entamoeba marina]